MNRFSVYRQPWDSSLKWAGRGASGVVCYEPSGGNVTISAWEASWVAALSGGSIIREPGGAGDNADKYLAAILQPTQEPENLIVAAHDNGQPTEPIYQKVEAFYKASKLAAPSKPVAMIMGLEQFRWPGKADFPRLVAACDLCFCDWYAIHRNATVQFMLDLFAQFKSKVAGPKLVGGFVECSAQLLDPSAYPHQRCPTPVEFLAEMNGFTAMGLLPILFPQVIGEAGQGGFKYDGMPPEILAALAAWAQPGPVPGPLPSPSPKPLTITISAQGYASQTVTLQPQP